MLHSVVAQFLRETVWGELDYLVVDMPPGTGDVALSLSQLLPSAGAVVVCTPQDVALLDATKAIAMFRKVNLDLLGMVENMSSFVCPHCGAREDIFGAGGAKLRAAELNVPFLGEVPLFKDLRVLADEGRLAEAVDHPAAKPYLDGHLSRAGRRLGRQTPPQSTIADPPGDWVKHHPTQHCPLELAGAGSIIGCILMLAWRLENPGAYGPP